MLTDTNPRIVLMTIVVALGGLLFGYDTAVISGAISSIETNFILPRSLSVSDGATLLGFVVASALIGTIFGAATAGQFAKRFGRRATLMIAALLFSLSAIGSAWPEIGFAPIGEMGTSALNPFIFYRILGGFAIGLASVVSPMYIAEIAPKNSRGRLVSIYQFAIVTGIVGVYFVNFLIAGLGDEAWLLSFGWRWMLASEAIFSLTFLLCLFLVPESPRWLVMQARNQEAEAILNKLGFSDRTTDILDEIQSSLISPQSGRLLGFGISVLFIGVLLSAFQQFVGINAVLYYAPSIFEDMGAGTNAALLQTTLVGMINFVFTVVAFLLVDRIGRRPLLVFGALIMSLSMATLGTLFFFEATGRWALVAMLIYVGGFAMSWGPVVWVLLSEMFPNSIRTKAMPIAVAAQWISNFVVSWSFSVLNGNEFLSITFNNAFAYWLFAVFSALAAVFVWRLVPETKEKSLEQIEALWSGSR